MSPQFSNALAKIEKFLNFNPTTRINTFNHVTSVLHLCYTFFLIFSSTQKNQEIKSRDFEKFLKINNQRLIKSRDFEKFLKINPTIRINI